MQTLDGLKQAERIFNDHIRVWDPSRFLHSSFELSSTKDQLVGLVRESLERRLWFSHFGELDIWSDEKKFQALEVFVAIIRPDNQVSVAFSQINPAETVVPV